jgi:hypothetical protein
VVLALLFAGGVIYFFFLPLLFLPLHPIIRAVFLAFLTIFFILGPLLTSIAHLLEKQHHWQRLTVNREGMILEERVGGRVQRREIAGEEIEELVLPTLQDTLAGAKDPGPGRETSPPRWLRAPGIFARSDRITLQFGQGLSEAELQYLFALIKRRLIA